MGLWPCVSNDGIRPSRCVRGTGCENRKRVLPQVSSPRLIADCGLGIVDCRLRWNRWERELPTSNRPPWRLVAAAIFVEIRNGEWLQLATGFTATKQGPQACAAVQKIKAECRAKGVAWPVRAPPMTVWPRLQVKRKALEAVPWDLSDEQSRQKWRHGGDASGAQVTSRDGAIRTLRDPDCGVISRNSLVIAGESSVHTAVCPTRPTHQLGHCQLSHRGAVGLSESGRWILLWGKSTLGSAGGMCVGPGLISDRTWPHQKQDSRCRWPSPAATGQFSGARCSSTQPPSRLLWLARGQGTDASDPGGVAPKPAA